MALLTAPTPSVRTDPRARLGSRAGGWLRSTPGRLTTWTVLLAVLGILAGTAAVVGITQRTALVDAVGSRSGPLTVRAQQLYRSLSDADATAASAFLSNGVEPAALRERYQADLASAAAALGALTAGTDTNRAATDRVDIARISAQLPVYAGLVETARTYNRLGKPLGAAYLREASGLMRTELLPAAKRLYTAVTDQLRADRAGGAEFPWLAVPLLLGTLAGLVLVQRYLSRRTHRLLNVGLLVATGAAVVTLGWSMVVWVNVGNHLDAGQRAGSSQVDLLAQARIAALAARADESLTLIARGGGDFDADYDQSMKLLSGDGQGGLLAQVRQQASDPAVRSAVTAAQSHVKQWRAAHQTLREKDKGGDYLSAVTLAIGAGPDSAETAFTALDTDLATAIAGADRVFDRQARAAGNGFTGAAAGHLVLTLLLLASLVAGLWRRIAEYR